MAKLTEMTAENKASTESLREDIATLASSNTLTKSDPKTPEKTWASITSEGHPPHQMTTQQTSMSGPGPGAGQGQQTRMNTTTQHSVRLEDDPRSIMIFANAYTGDKKDFGAIKDTCQLSISSFKVLNGVKIAYLRPLPNDRINMVFTTERGAELAREHTRWLTTALPNARMKGETWYPIKCDMVAKQAVLETESQDKVTLKPEVEANFKKDNDNAERDCTVRKVRWLSKANTGKPTGSAIIWLKNKQAADHLLQSGTAVFGACGAFVNQYIPTDNQGPCYRCNTYGHMQANCRRTTRCGICSKGHSTRDCTNRENPKCPACAGPHPIMDSRKCPRHPRFQSRPQKSNTEPSTSTSTQSSAGGITIGSEPKAPTQRSLQDGDIEMGSPPVTQC